MYKFLSFFTIAMLTGAGFIVLPNESLANGRCLIDTITITSSDSHFAVRDNGTSGNSVVPNPIPAYWTASIESANWMWSDSAPVNPPTTPGELQKVTFLKTFEIPAETTVLEVQLDIAADNIYAIDIDNQEILKDLSLDGDNYTLAKQDSLVLQPGDANFELFQPGETHEIKIVGTNVGGDGTEATAGVLYKLEITTRTCTYGTITVCGIFNSPLGGGIVTNANAATALGGTEGTSFSLTAKRYKDRGPEKVFTLDLPSVFDTKLDGNATSSDEYHAICSNSKPLLYGHYYYTDVATVSPTKSTTWFPAKFNDEYDGTTAGLMQGRTYRSANDTYNDGIIVIDATNPNPVLLVRLQRALD